MFERFKDRLNFYNRANNSLIDKNFNLDTRFIKIATVNVTKPMDLYISNLKGPSWIMIKILNQDGAILEAPTNGINSGNRGGPYVVSKATKYRVLIKAGIAGKYSITISD